MSRDDHNLKRLKRIRRDLRRRTTPAERTLWQMLKRRQLDGLKFRRQYSVGRYVVDFFCPEARLAVELDGAVHDDPLRSESDREREVFLRAEGIRVLRFENRLVFEQGDLVAEAIRAAARQGQE